jgi:predicted ATPase/class 3 adenylate cyclase/DNA-binding CsgD family transcriptional regulator
MPVLPTGTVTFLFTDIEGSTKLAREFPDALPAALAHHHAILQQAIDDNHGHVFQIAGDAFSAAFYHASDALAGALAAQRALQASLNDHLSPMIRVRMGIHTGDAEFLDGAYHGYLTLSRAQRLMSAASGRQVLVSTVSEGLLRGRLPAGVSLRELGAVTLKDFPEPERVFQMVAPDLPADFPPLKSLAAIPNNLPLQLTSFIGRERELAEVKRLLATTRLLTLTGSGGTGKTRLSLEVAAQSLDQFTDGVWFVELAPLADPALVPQTVAIALGVREDPGRPILTSLCEYVRDRDLLLMLDNCEHLLEACAQLADALLHAAPRLKVLASSREALGIAGEATYHVPSLPNPDPRARPPVAELAHYDAVRLFVERAQSAKSSFALDDANAIAVTQICQRLDGIPLAIELAAARLRAMSVEQIAARLDDRFRLLTGGNRTALPRQQTLRALIDWSYSLLTEPERLLLRRLSVFAGGWTLEAAEAVCADGRLEPEEVLDPLTHLVEKSLVVPDEQTTEPRYRLLETVRQYAREKLLDAGDGEATRSRHLAFFASLAAEAWVKLRSSGQDRWWPRVDAELDNFRTAIDWSLHGGDTAAGAAIVVSLWWFSIVRAYFEEAIGLLTEFLSRIDGAAQPALRANLLNAGGYLQFLTRNNFTEARRLAEEADEIGRALPAQPIVALSLTILSEIAHAQGEPEEGLRTARQALEIWRAEGDRWWESWVLHGLALSAEAVHDTALAYTSYVESVALFRSLGEKVVLAAPLRNLAYMALRKGDYGQASALAHESLGLNVAAGEQYGVAGCLTCLAAIAAAQGQPARAVQLLSAAEALMASLGIALLSRDQIEHDHWLRTIHTQVDPAAFEVAWAAGRALTLEQAIALALESPAAQQSAQAPSQSASMPEGQSGLTAREREVLHLLAEGLSNQQIAERLVVSAFTVRAHLRAIYGKLGVTTRSAATRYALEHHLV